jgi:hypothetical protein
LTGASRARQQLWLSFELMTFDESQAGVGEAKGVEYFAEFGCVQESVSVL